MKFPKLHTTDEAQEMYTPSSATDLIIPYLPKGKKIWEMCYGRGDMANHLIKKGFEVIGDKEIDCFTIGEEFLPGFRIELDFDIIVTNPPYKNNKKFLELAIKTRKPFAFLMRLEHLGGVSAMKLLQDLDFKILIPEKRINFITPKMQKGNNVGGSPFHSIWITYGLLETNKQITYI